jgi:hypothetical protein
MAIVGYSINGYLLLLYKWLLVVILLMVIDGYSIGGYLKKHRNKPIYYSKL